MIYLYIIVEGQSEEKFVKEILTPYFAPKNIFLQVERVITGKDKMGKACKGGGNSYQLYKNHLQNRIKQFSKNKNYFFTTMIDLYALPNDFPKIKEVEEYNDKYKSIAFLERAFFEDIGYNNFIPYIQLHEYETLLFCDINAIVDEFFDLDDGKLYETIINDIKKYDNIELINNSKETAPSKRLDKYTKGAYCGQKVTSSFNILQKIDISILRDKCEHFNYWLEKIEQLG